MQRIAISNYDEYGSAIADVTSASAVTPSDSATITKTRQIYVGVSGDVAVTMADGGDVTFKSMPVGFFSIGVVKIKATGTTATNILALY